MSRLSLNIRVADFMANHRFLTAICTSSCHNTSNSWYYLVKKPIKFKGILYYLYDNLENAMKTFLKILFVVLVIVLYLFSIDFYDFFKTCQSYTGKLTGAVDKVGPEAAIVVLTGDRHRIPRALELMRRKASQLLIISGAGRGATLTELVNQQGDAAVNIHEIWKRIVVESRSASTVENARESRDILEKHKIKQIILVTHDYHMPRSLEIFMETMPKVDIVAYPISSGVPLQKALSEYWKFRIRASAKAFR